MLKRLVDVGLSSVALVTLAPLLLIVALLIKLDSPGPVFHRAARVGRFGRTFRMFKFRSMVTGADRIGPPSTAADDPRITRIGRYVRRFNLDELSQLINVLRGEMSLVGPRPDLPQLVAEYPDKEREIILSVRPGITDWATLWIRDEGERLRGKPDPHQAYMEDIWPQKLRYQVEYVLNRSFWTDLRIMMLTVRVHLVDRFRTQDFRRSRLR